MRDNTPLPTIRTTLRVLGAPRINGSLGTSQASLRPGVARLYMIVGVNRARRQLSRARPDAPP
jgi:hypothetical protein